MQRILIATAAAAALGLGWYSAMGHDEAGPEKVTKLSERDIVEKLAGTDARATTVVVEFGPGVEGRPHRHPGPVFGYILEGDFELGLDEDPVQKLKAGDTFYEPSGAVHRVSRNPSDKAKTRLLAVLLHPRDAQAIVTPANGK